MRKITISIVALLVIGLPALAQTVAAAKTDKESASLSGTRANTNRTSDAEAADRIRTSCIIGRRTICGKVIKILPEGLVVDSGYTRLLQPPYNQSWLVDRGAMVSRDSKTLELNEPGSTCIGHVFLVDYPKRPKVKLYDYVVIQGYPVGKHTYTSVPGVQKTVREFSAGLDTAIRMNLDAGEK